MTSKHNFDQTLVNFITSGRRQLLVPEVQPAHVRRDVRLRRGARQGMPVLREDFTKTFRRRFQEGKPGVLVHRGPQGSML